MNKVREQEVETFNEQFNNDIERYNKKELPTGYRLQLGRPSVYLRSAGFDDLPITMRASLLRKKAGDEKHPFDASDIKGLVKAIQKPIAIFTYTKDNIRNLIVDVTRGDKHFLVGVTLNYKANGIEINSISGLFPKQSHEWIKWIQDGKHIRIDQKDKVLNLINSLRTNPAESERIGLNLNSVAKIVKDFENPNIPSENLPDFHKLSDGNINFFRTSSGEVYGFAYKGKIYIDPEIAGADTPIHEYAHLWSEALRQTSPDLWKKVVEQMKKCPEVWERVQKNYPELKDESQIAEEVLAHYSGERGRDRLMQEIGDVDDADPMLKAKVIAAVDRVKRTLQNVWKQIADHFGWNYTSPDRIADTVLKDIFDEEGLVGKTKQQGEAPTFYSNAMKALEGVKQKKATGEQWLGILRKNGGLKAGEDKWLGLSEWLQSRAKEGITKEEVLDFINQNMIKVEEVHYADKTHARYGTHWNYLREWLENNTDNPDAWYETITEFCGYRDGEGFYFGQGLKPHKQIVDMVERINKSIDKSNPINSTRMGYTTKGLDNKREIALTVPNIEPWNKGDDIHFGDAGEGRAIAWVRFGETTDADGNRVLVIDEIQSKRHQEGRERGYRRDDSPVEKRHRAEKAMGDYRKEMQEKYGEYFLEDDMTNDERAEYNRLYNEMKAAMYADNDKNKSYDIPDAPFDKNWHELAMKRMLRYAAENGYDKIAWTTGEQQAERYSLSDYVDKIEVTKIKEHDAVTGELFEGYEVMPKDKRGDVILSTEGQFAGRMTSDDIIRSYGKDLGNRMIEAAEKKGYSEAATIDGENLKIGGEGMRGFYDQMLPRFMDKYGKKWGVKTHDINLPRLEKSAQTMHAIDVTTEMRETVLDEGQPMFQKADKGAEYGEGSIKVRGKDGKEEDILIRDFVKDIDSRHVSKITTESDIERLSEYGVSDDFIKSIKKDFESEDVVGRYIPELGEVILYQNNIEKLGLDKDDVMATIVHENIHSLSGGSYSAEDFARTAELIKQVNPKFYDDIQQKHEGFVKEVIDEEVVGHFIHRYVENGAVDDLINHEIDFGNPELNSRIDHIVELLKDRNYEKRRENEESINGRRVNSSWETRLHETSGEETTDARRGETLGGSESQNSRSESQRGTLTSPSSSSSDKSSESSPSSPSSQNDQSPKQPNDQKFRLPKTFKDGQKLPLEIAWLDGELDNSTGDVCASRCRKHGKLASASQHGNENSLVKTFIPKNSLS